MAKPKQETLPKLHGGSLYRHEYAHTVYTIALLGATDRVLADAFDVSEETIQQWKHDHPEFATACKKGRIFSDMYVSQSLYGRAVGFEREEEQAAVHQGRVVRYKINKYYPPDPTSAIFWLKARAGWKDRNADEEQGAQGNNFTRIERVYVTLGKDPGGTQEIQQERKKPGRPKTKTKTKGQSPPD